MAIKKNNYRMNPETKRMLSLLKFSGPEQRAAFKKIMVDAECADSHFKNTRGSRQIQPNFKEQTNSD